MPRGIRATVEFPTPDSCPVVECSAETGATVEGVDSNIRPGEGRESVVEFEVAADGEFDAGVEPLFSHGATERYRLRLDGDPQCPCACLAEFDCPVVRYVARDGDLTLVFHAADYDQLRELVEELRDRFPDVNLKRFVRAPDGEEAGEYVVVDRSRLTPRQLEVLRTAHERGYFERPRRANATEIAAELDVNPSTFREHLVAAESKILGDLL
mgnify:CR=1 FL=1